MWEPGHRAPPFLYAGGHCDVDSLTYAVPDCPAFPGVT